MFKSSSAIFALTTLALAFAAGCGRDTHHGGSGGAPAAATAAPIDAAEAREIFTSRCAACHGPQGLGDGPGAPALNPKPRNYHDKSWQSRVTDADIRRTITYGGAAVGKSPMMPASPDLEAKPEVIDGLVRIVRDFGKS